MAGNGQQPPSTTAPATELSSAFSDGLAGDVDASHDPPGRLVRSTESELATARAHRDALVAAAVELAVAAGHDPDVAACAEAGCLLAGAEPHGPALCATAHRLARLPDAPPATGAVPFTLALAGFHTALVTSADAIRTCRQTAHAGRGCWFSPAPGLDGCGEVLRLLHRCC